LIKAMLNTSAPPMAALAVVLPAMARKLDFAGDHCRHPLRAAPGKR